jgi:PAS domain S-box-containing protein
VHERRGRILRILAIVAISAGLGTLVDWRAPGIERYARDRLIQARGVLPPPDDIAIVAIDEASIARFGRFPWPRPLAARAIDAIAASQPRAIALDVLYTDPTTQSEDAALAQAIARAGNVVVAAQLSEGAAWLMPLPPIASAAAAVGHVNVSTESEGIARQLLVRAADDAGHVLRAMAIETVRIGDRTPEQEVTDAPHALLLGSRVIPVDVATPTLVIGGAVQRLRAGRMSIDYIGPAGSFAPRTYSFAEVIDGRVPGGVLRGKYVLIGATAASLGDRVASPFVHQGDARGNQHGSLMPGVEVLANALNTILRARFYAATPDWMGFVLAALAAAATLGLLALAQGRHEMMQQIGVLAGLAAAILLAGYLMFTRFLLFPPLTPAMVSFASAGILGLLGRSLATSARLDLTIQQMARRVAGFARDPAGADAVEAVAHLTGASGVAIFASDQRRVAAWGAPVRPGQGALTVPLDGGVLAIAHNNGRQPSREMLQLAGAIASAAVGMTELDDEPAQAWWQLPRGVEAKARSLSRLNQRILAHARFFDSALRSVEDALIIAGAGGRITFVNRRAAGVLGSSPEALIGGNLFERLAEAEGAAAADLREVLRRLLIDRNPIEREIAVRGARPRRYMLRIAAVSEGDQPNSAVLGIVASLSDITRQHELQQTKNDVMALVSHEMRTPLSAIQGMSELLAQYDLDAERRRQMNLAINDEVKRLTRMITEYLDIARLESGATVLRRSPVRVEPLVERCLLLFDPLAGQKQIRLARRLDAGAPAVLADADLLARAVGNLISNAIKYSAPGTEVAVTVCIEPAGVAIEVTDHGPGIPAADLDRIFEKFYRVPRVEDADTPGTGLGLALVREVAELHGGNVSATSIVGAGSTFKLRIPRMEEPHGTMD